MKQMSIKTFSARYFYFHCQGTSEDRSTFGHFFVAQVSFGNDSAGVVLLKLSNQHPDV
jgi:hypothetical protein